MAHNEPLCHKKMNTAACLFVLNHSFVHHLLSHEAFPIGLVFQPLPQRMSVVPVHVNLTEHVKLNMIGLCKLLDLSFIAWLL